MTLAPGGAALKAVVAVAAVALGAYLVWALRSLIVPIAVGGLVTYICRPLVARLERGRVQRGVAVALLLIVFVVTGMGDVDQRAHAPWRAFAAASASALAAARPQGGPLKDVSGGPPPARPPGFGRVRTCANLIPQKPLGRMTSAVSSAMPPEVSERFVTRRRARLGLETHAARQAR